MNSFVKPLFNKKSLEFRFEDETVCIYGTREGLKSLSDLLLGLIENPGQGHIHIEDKRFDELTKESKKAAIAIFER